MAYDRQDTLAKHLKDGAEIDCVLLLSLYIY